MNDLFADTGYWIGLINRRDHLHAKIGALRAKLGTFSLVTSEMVLAEFLNGVSNDGHLRKAAVVIVDSMRAMKSATVVSQTPDQFQAAIQRYKHSIDNEWSLTDCSSFLIMEERGIRAALTHDLHFVQAGFDALLR